MACPNNANCGLKTCNKDGKKACNKEMKIDGSMCHKKGKHKGRFLGNIYYTLKNLGLAKSDWSDASIAIKAYKEDMRKLHIATPVRSIKKGKLDRKLFISSHPAQKKLIAQAELIETLLLVLNEDQRSRFAMLLGASQYQNKLHPQRGQAHCKNKKMCPKK